VTAHLYYLQNSTSSHITGIDLVYIFLQVLLTEM